MSSSITEELHFRKLIRECAIKYKNNDEAARRHHTRRQEVQCLVKRYDGIIEYLRLRNHRLHSHPNQHTLEELSLICPPIR